MAQLWFCILLWYSFSFVCYYGTALVLYIIMVQLWFCILLWYCFGFVYTIVQFWFVHVMVQPWFCVYVMYSFDFVYYRRWYSFGFVYHYGTV